MRRKDFIKDCISGIYVAVALIASIFMARLFVGLVPSYLGWQMGFIGFGVGIFIFVCIPRMAMYYWWQPSNERSFKRAWNEFWEKWRKGKAFD